MDASPACGTFDADTLRLRGILAFFADLSLRFANPLFCVLRFIWPNPWLPSVRYVLGIPLPWLPLWVLVTRREDVLEVMDRQDVFAVAMSAETRLLNDGRPDGTNFVLGLADGEEYRWQLGHLMRAFPREEVRSRVAPIAQKAAERVVAASGGTLDAVQDLITRVPLEICRDYYGVDVPAARMREVSQWTIAVSGYLFGPPFDRPRTHAAAVAGAACLREMLDRSIDAACRPGAPSHTVLARLLTVQRTDPRMTRLVVRAFLMGMIIGFVPTNTLAGGHMLEVLLDHKDRMAAARAAALAGDDEQLRRCLFETLRWMPHNPGPWRECREPYTIAAGTWRARRVRSGRLVLACTQSAMFDARQVRDPCRFDPGRDAGDSLLMGHGLHFCAGRYIAEAQLVQTLKPLLRRDGLERARGRGGRMQRLGLFPEHLHVVFRT